MNLSGAHYPEKNYRVTGLWKHPQRLIFCRRELLRLFRTRSTDKDGSTQKDDRNGPTSYQRSSTKRKLLSDWAVGTCAPPHLQQKSDTARPQNAFQSQICEGTVAQRASIGMAYTPF